MSYIGATPAESYASFYVQHFTTSATTSYALDYPVVNENDLRLVINNVVQQPGSSYAYTAAASTLTLSAATTTSDTMYAVFLGRALQTVNPPGDSVGVSQLADTVISGQTALGAEPADTDEFLVSDAGTLKRMDYSHIKAGAGGAWTLIKTLTASSDATLSFVDGASDVVFDSTYDHYVFIFNSIHPSADGEELTWQVSTDGGSNYNIQSIDSSIANYIRDDNASDHSLEVDDYVSSGTGYKTIIPEFNFQAEASGSGELHIYAPAGTVHYKQYYSQGSNFVYYGTDYQMQSFSSGKFRTTSALDAVQFKMSSGNIDSGKISLYGITS